MAGHCSSLEILNCDGVTDLISIDLGQGSQSIVQEESELKL